MILAVASIWNDRKGLPDLTELAKRLPEDKYALVVVGLSSEQIKALNRFKSPIIALPRTSSAGELAEIYSAADVFVNPTHEDTFPTVNMEAEACGTPVITYNTGGCAETIHRPDSKVIEASVDKLKEAILSTL